MPGCFSIRLLVTLLASSSSQSSAWTTTILQRPHDCAIVRRSSLRSIDRHGRNFKTQGFIRPGASSLSSSQTHNEVKGITLKIALDSTGAAADLSADKSERFTSSESLDMVHRLRRDSDAVLVGRNTVQADNPSLTVRRGVIVDQQPLRVVLDPLLKLIPKADEYSILHDGLPTVVYHNVPDIGETLLNLEAPVTCVYMPVFDLSLIVEHLKATFGVEHLMVEGGPRTARLFLPLLDRALIVKAPLCFKEPLNSGISAKTLQGAGLVCLGETKSGVDMIECWSKPDEPWPTDRLSDWP